MARCFGRPQRSPAYGSAHRYEQTRAAGWSSPRRRTRRGTARETAIRRPRAPIETALARPPARRTDYGGPRLDDPPDALTCDSPHTAVGRIWEKSYSGIMNTPSLAVKPSGHHSFCVSLVQPIVGSFRVPSGPLVPWQGT